MPTDHERKAGVKKVLSWYAGEPTAVITNLARVLEHGELAGTGRVSVLPIDQDFELGHLALAPNSEIFSAKAQWDLAIEAGFSAFAATLGTLRQFAADPAYVGRIPLILKINSSSPLSKGQSAPDQALTASVKAAKELGCVGVGFTHYLGSPTDIEMTEELKDVIAEARDEGLFTAVWSYARRYGENAKIKSNCEQAIDVISDAARVAVGLGAHMVKIKMPNEKFGMVSNEEKFKEFGIPYETQQERLAHVVNVTGKRRLIVVAGGDAKDEQGVLAEVTAGCLGGTRGVAMGRNAFQLSAEEARGRMAKIHDILRNTERAPLPGWTPA